MFGLIFTGRGSSLSSFPVSSCALIGLFVALLLGLKDISRQVRVFCQGIADETVILMCLIFLLAGAFASVSKLVGSDTATVNLGLLLF